MKKKKLIFFIFMVLILIAFVPYKNRTYIESKVMYASNFCHERNSENSLIFKGKSILIGGYNIRFEESVYKKENVSRVVSIIRKDLCNIHGSFKNAKKGYIYVVPEEWGNVSKEKNSVFTSVKDVVNGNYLKDCAEEFVEIKGEWKRLSIKEILRNDLRKRSVEEYLRSKDIKFALSLNPIVLDKRINPNYKKAESLFIDYGVWVYKKYGGDAFLKDGGDRINEYYQEKTNQLKHVNIDQAFKEGTEFKVIKTNPYTIENESFTLVFTKEFKGTLESEYKAIKQILHGNQCVKNTLRNSNIVSDKKLNRKMKAIISYVGKGNACSRNGNKIVICNNAVEIEYVMHELVHLYSDYVHKNDNEWLVEGTAVYIEALAEQEAYKKGYISEMYCPYFYNKDKYKEEEKKFFEELVKKYEYLKKDKMKKKNFDKKLYCNCAAAIAFDYPVSGNNRLSESYAYKPISEVVGIYNNKNILNDMSYYQAALFVDYLMEHNMNKQIRDYGYSKLGFEKHFGMNEKKMYMKFKKWVDNKYNK